jgi:hypothetical protein
MISKGSDEFEVDNDMACPDVFEKWRFSRPLFGTGLLEEMWIPVQLTSLITGKLGKQASDPQRA